MLLNDLIGTWFLQEWDCTLDGHYHNHPFGRDAQGVISYSPSGRMSAILMKPNRPHLSVASLLQASDEEKIMVVHGYVSYAGEWRVENDQVIHAVDHSLLPNWIGTDLIRNIRWTAAHGAPDEPKQLILSTEPQKTRSGKLVVNRLRWKIK
ncbi:MAG: lipocalin-like domain-containing protein [Chloroflexota bacterium]